MMMHMTLYWGIEATLLVDGWVTSTYLQYSLSLLAIFLFAILHEWLFNLRIVLGNKKVAAPRAHHDPEHTVPILEKAHVPQGQWKCGLSVVLYGINAATSFLLMLLVMSYNGGVFLAVVVGLLIGFGLFRTPVNSDSSNSCDVCHAG